MAINLERVVAIHQSRGYSITSTVEYPYALTRKGGPSSPAPLEGVYQTPNIAFIGGITGPKLQAILSSSSTPSEAAARILAVCEGKPEALAEPDDAFDAMVQRSIERQQAARSGAGQEAPEQQPGSWQDLTNKKVPPAGHVKAKGTGTGSLDVIPRGSGAAPGDVPLTASEQQQLEEAMKRVADEPPDAP